MTLCTAYLLSAPGTATPEPRRTRYAQTLTCGICGKTYTLDYESSCTDPDDVAVVVDAARRVITWQEHFSGHRDARIEIANTIHHPIGLTRLARTDGYGFASAAPSIPVVFS
jgi:hypothetical protein